MVRGEREKKKSRRHRLGCSDAGSNRSSPRRRRRRARARLSGLCCHRRRTWRWRSCSADRPGCCNGRPGGDRGLQSEWAAEISPGLRGDASAIRDLLAGAGRLGARGRRGASWQKSFG